MKLKFKLFLHLCVKRDLNWPWCYASGFDSTVTDDAGAQKRKKERITENNHKRCLASHL